MCAMGGGGVAVRGLGVPPDCSLVYSSSSACLRGMEMLLLCSIRGISPALEMHSYMTYAYQQHTRACTTHVSDITGATQHTYIDTFQRDTTRTFIFLHLPVVSYALICLLRSPAGCTGASSYCTNANCTLLLLAGRTETHITEISQDGRSQGVSPPRVTQLRRWVCLTS